MILSSACLLSTNKTTNKTTNKEHEFIAVVILVLIICALFLGTHSGAVGVVGAVGADGGAVGADGGSEMSILAKTEDVLLSGGDLEMIIWGGISGHAKDVLLSSGNHTTKKGWLSTATVPPLAQKTLKCAVEMCKVISGASLTNGILLGSLSSPIIFWGASQWLQFGSVAKFVNALFINRGIILHVAKTVYDDIAPKVKKVREWYGVWNDIKELVSSPSEKKIFSVVKTMVKLWWG
eukprot:TRINITY_DN810_c0_g4_i1.p1 TRINITY_DN810_c0_g4~~TRINITY_DN810_c0_g4_i1.p1  ORF type:complete len:236 (+),score=42.95 TRINITY_DN810_c0_g4_i1:156-863(+)